MLYLDIDRFLDKHEHFHLARITRESASSNTPLHSHNFAECFWLEEGEAIHQINDSVQNCQKGDLIFIRPSDRHVLIPKGEAPLVYYNFAMRTPPLLQFHKTIFSEESETFWDWSTEIPDIHKLDDVQLLDLNEATQKLLIGKNNPPKAAWFVCELYRIMDSKTHRDQKPPWLYLALELIKKPENFREGARVFSKLCHFSHEHISRSMKKYIGKTPSCIINEARMHYAIRMLRLTDISIVNLSIDCGFQSLNQFYRVFKQYTKMTPMKFREKNQQIN